MDSKYGKIALCLAGGGGRGITQAGMLQAWKEFGLEYDLLFGTSVGALNGVMVHQGQYDVMIDLWLKVKTKEVYNWNLGNIFSPFSASSCIFDSKPLDKLIRKVLNVPALYANPKPFIVNATDLKTWGPVSYNVKDVPIDELPNYLRASAAPPVLFPPISFRGKDLNSAYDDTVLIDGGIVNNFSVFSAVAAGVDTIVVMSPTVPEPKIPSNLIDMIGLLGSIPEYEYLERELKFVEKLNTVADLVPNLRKIKVVRIQPPKPTGVGLLDFEYEGKNRRQLIADGYNLAMNILKKELV